MSTTVLARVAVAQAETGPASPYLETCIPELIEDHAGDDGDGVDA